MNFQIQAGGVVHSQQERAPARNGAVVALCGQYSRNPILPPEGADVTCDPCRQGIEKAADTDRVRRAAVELLERPDATRAQIMWCPDPVPVVTTAEVAEETGLPTDEVREHLLRYLRHEFDATKPRTNLTWFFKRGSRP